MTLAELFALEPAPIYGQFVRREAPLGPWPDESRKLSPAAIAQRRAARQSQLGQSKAANRVKR